MKDWEIDWSGVAEVGLLVVAAYGVGVAARSWWAGVAAFIYSLYLLRLS